MIPREVVGVAAVPDGPPLRLVRHGGDFIIMLDRNELMSSRMSGSEVALAELACAELAARNGAKLLIGGYGMGFTLRAALAALAADARVVVAELVPDVIAWARGPMRELAAGCLDDPRVEVVIGDVGAAMAGAAATGAGFDAILLDVDNGPDAAVRPANEALYSPAGLARARAALRPGGVLAVWSAAPDAAFTRRLRAAGFAVEEHRVRARAGGKGPMHLIWRCTAAGAPRTRPAR